MGFLVMGVLWYLSIVGDFSVVSWILGSAFEAGGENTRHLGAYCFVYSRTMDSYCYQ